MRFSRNFDFQKERGKRLSDLISLRSYRSKNLAEEFYKDDVLLESGSELSLNEVEKLFSFDGDEKRKFITSFLDELSLLSRDSTNEDFPSHFVEMREGEYLLEKKNILFRKFINILNLRNDEGKTVFTLKSEHFSSPFLRNEDTFKIALSLFSISTPLFKDKKNLNEEFKNLFYVLLSNANTKIVKIFWDEFAAISDAIFPNSEKEKKRKIFFGESEIKEWKDYFLGDESKIRKILLSLSEKEEIPPENIIELKDFLISLGYNDTFTESTRHSQMDESFSRSAQRLPAEESLPSLSERFARGREFPFSTRASSGESDDEESDLPKRIFNIPSVNSYHSLEKHIERGDSSHTSGGENHSSITIDRSPIRAPQGDRYAYLTGLSDHTPYASQESNFKKENSIRIKGRVIHSSTESDESHDSKSLQPSEICIDGVNSSAESEMSWFPQRYDERVSSLSFKRETLSTFEIEKSIIEERNLLERKKTIYLLLRKNIVKVCDFDFSEGMRIGESIYSSTSFDSPEGNYSVFKTDENDIILIFNEDYSPITSDDIREKITEREFNEHLTFEIEGNTFGVFSEKDAFSDKFIDIPSLNEENLPHVMSESGSFNGIISSIECEINEFVVLTDDENELIILSEFFGMLPSEDESENSDGGENTDEED